MIGETLGRYRVTAKLGEGGMGVVYRATDSDLRREVALKVLPDSLLSDPERTARFEREARVLASLNHPNVAQIYGLESRGARRALVMELVEGPTLADRLAGGPLDLDEALAVACQIAEALEEAHAKGIVHRDLKPANVKLAPGGRVKVLDFGLAKAFEGEAAPGSASQLGNSPTLTRGSTAVGVILGSAAYMSPEQAKGKAVDKRSDIWSFGVVLFEMLSGRHLFAGDSVTETLAAVLRADLAWEELPAHLPPSLVRLLRRCLERDPRRRLHDIADARIVLEEVAEGVGDDLPAPAPRPAGGPPCAPGSPGPPPSRSARWPPIRCSTTRAAPHRRRGRRRRGSPSASSPSRRAGRGSRPWHPTASASPSPRRSAARPTCSCRRSAGATP